MQDMHGGVFSLCTEANRKEPNRGEAGGKARSDEQGRKNCRVDQREANQRGDQEAGVSAVLGTHPNLHYIPKVKEEI